MREEASPPQGLQVGSTRIAEVIQLCLLTLGSSCSPKRGKPDAIPVSPRDSESRSKISSSNGMR